MSIEYPDFLISLIFNTENYFLCSNNYNNLLCIVVKYNFI